jgi:hypothetical protein
MSAGALLRSTTSQRFNGKETEHEMDFDRESNVDFRVLRGQNNQWHVTEQDLRQPVASFDSPHEACAWAIARAKPKRGRVFVEGTCVDYSSFTADPNNHRRPPTQHRGGLLTRKTGVR